jgi:hypothetical protein
VKAGKGPGRELAETGENRVGPAPGEWEIEAASDWRKEAGEEGGTANGRMRDGGWFKLSDAGTEELCGAGSGTRTACPIRFVIL